MSPRQLFIILVRRSWLIALIFLATMAGAGALLFLASPRFDAQATASIDPGQSDPVTGQSVGVNALRIVQGNFVALAKSSRVASDVVKRLNLTSNPNLMAQYRGSDSVGLVNAQDWIGAELLRSMDAKFNEGTNVLVITYKSPNAILASQVANTFMAAFMDAAIEAKVVSAQQTAQWFEPQVEKLRVEVEEARQRMSRFQTSAKLAPTAPGEIDGGVLQQITNEIGTTKADALKIRSALAQADASAVADKDPTSPFDSPLMQSLKTNLSNTAAEIGRVQSTVGANNPKLLALLAAQKSLQAQIANERREQRANLEARLKSLEAQIASLEKSRSDQLANVIAMQAQRDQLTLLLRDVEVAQERYVAATKAAASARLQGQLSFSSIAILDRAVTPVAPAFPKPALVIPAAIAAGFGLGCIIALIAEALNRRIRVARDLEFATPAPSLGVMLSTPVSRRAHRRHKLAMIGGRA